jgi:alginate O-acetyltransferase complex protein AlgI
MLFNSLEFVFVFLPLTLIGYHWARSRGYPTTQWLLVSSLVFYAWWDWRHLAILIPSIVVNFLIGILILDHPRYKGKILASGIFLNLALLSVFKYFNFFIQAVLPIYYSAGLRTELDLPLGISFFTFTQIAFLCDVYWGRTREQSPTIYATFVAFFPHLIAGPIVQHREIAHQFTIPFTGSDLARDSALGLTIFAAALAKKVFLSDPLGDLSDPVFAAAERGELISFADSWLATLGFAFRIYFDFSAYSEMAIGLALMFGIRFPVNFFSPYKAKSIVDFWRRWHMTLSFFLRDYLYIPLGGNRHGSLRQYSNLLITMLLGGLWHGAGWTFVIWGGLHGVLLLINHFWLSVASVPWLASTRRLVPGRLLTFLSVVTLWVFFRAETLDGALILLRGLIGLNGVVVPQVWLERLGSLPTYIMSGDLFLSPARSLALMGGLLLHCWYSPNVLQVVGYGVDEEQSAPIWRPNLAWALLVAVLLGTSMTQLARAAQFLYFKF